MRYGLAVTTVSLMITLLAALGFVVGCEGLSIDSDLIPPKTKIIDQNENEQGYSVRVASDNNAKDIKSFYLKTLKAKGWQEKINRHAMTKNGKKASLLAFLKEEKGIMIDIIPQYDNKTIISIYREL